MEFSLICPNDGEVEVGLEDISSIVFNGFESVDVVFVCPECGTEIRVQAKMPNLLITTLDLSDALERSLEVAAEGGFIPMDEDDVIEAEIVLAAAEPSLSEDDEERIEHYCEYFKRQLARVDTVEAFLHEVDQK
jgi:hypothetical protein